MTAIIGENGTAQKTAGTFKYEGAAYFSVAMFVVMSALGFALWIMDTTRRGSIPFVEVVIIAVYLFLLMGMIIATMGRSEVIVDEQGISRRFMGLWTWKRIRWDNIREITTSPLSFVDAKGPRMVRGILIYPTVPPRVRLSPSGKFGFPDSVVNWGDLIEIMNHYITQYKIEVVVFGTEKGGATATHL